MKIPAKLLETTFIVFLFLFSFRLMLFPFEASHYWDESVYLQHAEIFSDGRTNYSELDSRPPFLSFLISLGYVVWHNMYMAQIVVALINTLGVIALYFLTKRLVNWQAGMISSIAFSTSPFVMEHTHYILTDVPSFSLLITSILFFYKAIDTAEKRGYYMLVSGLVFGLSILTRFTSLFFFLFFMTVFYIHRDRFIQKPVQNRTSNEFRFLSDESYRTGRIIAAKFLFGMLISLLPYFIFAQMNYGFFLFPLIKAQLIIAASSPEPFFYYVHHFLNIFGVPVTIGLFLGTISLLTALIKKVKKNEKIESPKKDLVLLLLFFFAFFIYFSIMSHKEERYLMPIFFAAYILSGYGLMSLISFFSKSRRATTFCSFVIILLIFAANSSALSEHFKKSIINDAKTETILVSEFLRMEVQNNARVYSALNYPVIAYYSGKDVRALLPRTNKLECGSASFKKYGIEKNSYLIVFPKIDTYERNFVDYDSIETCAYLDKVKEISGVIIYKIK